MRPRNFPAKVERRALRSVQAKGQKTEPERSALESYRSIRSKKVKVGKKR